MSGPRWVKVPADAERFANMRSFAKMHGIALELHEKAACRGVYRYRIGEGAARVTTNNPMNAWATLRTMAGEAK